MSGTPTPLCTEPVPNRDPQTKVRTELWLVCTVTPLVLTMMYEWNLLKTISKLNLTTVEDSRAPTNQWAIVEPGSQPTVKPPLTCSRRAGRRCTVCRHGHTWPLCRTGAAMSQHKVRGCYAYAVWAETQRFFCFLSVETAGHTATGAEEGRDPEWEKLRGCHYKRTHKVKSLHCPSFYSHCQLLMSILTTNVDKYHLFISTTKIKLEVGRRHVRAARQITVFHPWIHIFIN